MSKSFFIQTYGCQMNYHDSERLHGILESIGYREALDSSDADVVIINTCAVREKPERKLFAELGRLRKIKLKRPEMIIGVAGCMAPREEDVLKKSAPYVDILIGPRSLHRLPELLHRIQQKRQGIYALDLEDDPTPITPVSRSNRISAWVNIMFGCNYACSFCAVPSARGKEVSRPPEEILDEIKVLNAQGYKEVTLLGQTVNAYGRDFFYRIKDADNIDPEERVDFSWLLRQIDSRFPGFRIRFTSPHPQLFSDRLIETIAELSTVCEHVHLPLQSADDEVLHGMRRSYTYSKFQHIVNKLREAVPDIAISTDIIVGFPGETEEKFRKTLAAVKDLKFDQAFMFAYSPRRHTEAFDFEGEIHPEIQNKRLQELIEIANQSFNDINKLQLERTFEVLVEGPSTKNPARMSGRTRGNKTMIFDAPESAIGQLIQVKATESFLWGFKGEMNKANNKTKTTHSEKFILIS